MKKMQDGKLIDIRNVCLTCNCEINRSWCSYSCIWDSSKIEERPPGTVAIRTYEIKEILISEEIK